MYISGQFGGILNESLTDPVLRTFRKPLLVRMREKLDERSLVIDAQRSAIAKMGRENAQLKRDARKADRELAALRVRVHRAERLVLDEVEGGA